MYTLCVQSEISSAHRLNFYQGECQRIHGHNWKIKATVSGQELDELGMVIDLMVLQQILTECLAPYDHRLLNEVPPFDQINPTSENLARHIFQWLKKNVPAKIRVEQIEVFETDKLSVSYREDAAPR